MKLFIAILLIISSSVNSQENVLYEQFTNNVPELNEKTEVYLGDRMLVQRQGEYRECIIPKNTYEKAYAMTGYTIQSQQALCKRNADREFYTPVSYHIMDVCDPGESCIETFVRFVKKNEKLELHICQPKLMGKGGNCPRKLRVKNLSSDEVELNDRYFIYTINSFQQTIEYAGRDENILKFTYSEFTDGFAKQAFTREFQIDYAKGDVAAYKGAIIKIHDATNVNIVYEVIRNFQQ